MASGFQSYLEDLLAPLGGVRMRRMFGGLGVYCHGVMFALVSDDVLYLKADDMTRGAFEAEGGTPFRYEARGRSVTMSYWRPPERLFDEPDEFREWALAAVAAARRARAESDGSKPSKSGGSKPKRRRP